MKGGADVRVGDQEQPRIVLAFAAQTVTRRVAALDHDRGALVVRDACAIDAQVVGAATIRQLVEELCGPVALEELELVIAIERMGWAQIYDYPGLADLHRWRGPRWVQVQRAEVNVFLGWTANGQPPSTWIADRVVERLPGAALPDDETAVWVAAVALAAGHRVWGGSPQPSANPDFAQVPTRSRCPARGLREPRPDPPSPGSPSERAGLLTVSQIAELVGRSRVWVYRHIAGRIRPVRPPGSRCVWYRRSDIDQLIESWRVAEMEVAAPEPSSSGATVLANAEVSDAVARWRLRRS